MISRKARIPKPETRFNAEIRMQNPNDHSDFSRTPNIFPLVVGREIERRKRKRLLTKKSGPTASAVRSNQVRVRRDRRPATRPPETNGPKSPGQVGLRSPPVVSAAMREESSP